MTAIDRKGLCLAYALDRAREITGLRIHDEALLRIATTTIETDQVPDQVPGVRRLQIDDFGAPGDILVMRGGAGLHAMVAVGGGAVEDTDPRGRRRRVLFRRISWLAHSCWRLTG